MHIYLYASMTRILSKEEEAKLGGQDRWGFTPADPMGSTVRKISDQNGTRLIIRNRISWAPSLTVSEAKLKQIARKHRQSFLARFPVLSDVPMEHHWGGLLCMSRNNVSAFGELEDELYSACCQNGLGTTKGTLNGILAAELASNIQSDHLEFTLAEEAPQKLPPEPFASIGANAYMRWGEFKAGKEL